MTARWKLYTIYLDPTDLAPGYAVREWEAAESGLLPGPILASGLDSLAGARGLVPDAVDACLQRSPDDDPTIVETWL